jgi:hypothetical protein
LNTKIIVIIAIVAGIASMAIMIGFIGQGNVRHVPIFWQEKIEQTIVFEDIDDETRIRGILGIGGEDINPHIVVRTNFLYNLTVINNGDKHHRLFIDGLNVQTDLLEPGQQETLTIYPVEEGIYNYYDKRERLKKLGVIEVRTVVPSDEFTGVFRDLI